VGQSRWNLGSLEPRLGPHHLTEHRCHD
jgi:hypothetical protein